MRSRVDFRLASFGFLFSFVAVFVWSCGSADPELMSFRSYRSGAWKIYVMQADGSNQTRVTSGPALDLDPAISPDGSTIAFTSNRKEREIHTIGLDGKGLKQITDSPDDLECCPRWSPDGKKISYTSGPVSGGGAARRIFVMDADGSNVVRLTDNDAPEEASTWSPDGRKLAFSASLGDGNWDIYSIGVDGSDQQRLTESSAVDVQPVWSPVGDRIAFLSNREGEWEVFVMRSDGTRPERITGNSEVNERGGLAWSPDGLAIAFVSVRDGNSNIYTISIETRDEQRITTNLAADLSPSWISGGVPK